MSPPCSSFAKHPAVPPLANVGLEMFSYLPQPLVAQTRHFFETETLLLPSQLAAKDSFLFLFLFLSRLRQDHTRPDVDRHIHAGGAR
jgi:hypothetical protein